jgi:hypothetical protein
MQVSEPNEMRGLRRILGRLENIDAVLGSGVDFSLISDYTGDPALR